MKKCQTIEGDPSNCQSPSGFPGQSSLAALRAWYAGLPGAIRFFDGIDLAEISTQSVAKQDLDTAVNTLLSGMADGLIHPRYAGIFKDSHSIAALYRQAARSMSIISSTVAQPE